MSFSNRQLFTNSGLFINSSTAIRDALFGLTISNPNVCLLNYGKVVVRKDYSTADIVKIISGGASGHEPAHAGFVGKGMLTAAIQGEVFSSPSTSEVLKTIKEVSLGQYSGVLVIVQNDVAERLNFGLAVERACSQGILIKIIVVSDDCCHIDEHYGRRGLTGIVLLNKIAGAMAEIGCTLDEIFHFCQKVHDNITSICISLKLDSSSTIDICSCTTELAPALLEIGSDIYGKTRVKGVERCTADNVASMIVQKVSENFVLDSNTPIVILINYLSQILDLDKLFLLKELIQYLQGQKVSVARVYHGCFYSAPNIKGFTITFLKVFDSEVLKYLDFQCEAPAWGTKIIKDIPTGICEPIQLRAKNQKTLKTIGLSFSENESNLVFLAVQFACDALISCERQLNIIDGESGSGNLGTKMKFFSEIVLKNIKNKTFTFHQPSVFFGLFSLAAEKYMSGTLGFLYSILFEAAANYFRLLPENHLVNVYTWYGCLKEACGILKTSCKAEFGNGTMYDPLYAFCLKIKDGSHTTIKVLDRVGLAVSAAEEIVKDTRHSSNRYSDPGAHAVGIWMRAVYEAMKLRFED